MFNFLETDIKEQKKYEMRAQTSVDNTVNDLCYEIKFEFFLIIMRIDITTNKYTANKICKMKNEPKYTNIYKTELIQNHLNYYIRKLKLEERR